MKVRIDVMSEPGNRYRAIIQIGHNPEPPADKKIIYTSLREAEQSKGYLIKNLISELKEKAQKWVREEGIKYVTNLDPESPYP